MSRTLLCEREVQVVLVQFEGDYSRCQFHPGNRDSLYRCDKRFIYNQATLIASSVFLEADMRHHIVSLFRRITEMM